MYNKFIIERHWVLKNNKNILNALNQFKFNLIVFVINDYGKKIEWFKLYR